MTATSPSYRSLDEWIAREAIGFSLDSPAGLSTAIDRLLASLGNHVELLGFGEAIHGSEQILLLRNQMFQHLVRAHGYRAITVESSFTRSHIVNDYIAGRGPDSYDAIRETGFSHGFGRLTANRELVEWMRLYNADASHTTKLTFDGFDNPTEMYGSDSPRAMLQVVLDYLALIDGANLQERRQRIDSFLGDDAGWENPAATFDPTKSIGLSPAATALRIEADDLLIELQTRRPELIAKTGGDRYLQAERFAAASRQFLAYHATIARSTPNRIVEILSIRDLMMADHLAYTVARERDRGKIFAFAHNSHLKRGLAVWQLGPQALAWWPAGAHLGAMLGDRYAVIGSGIGVSEANGIAPPEAGTLEAQLCAAPGPARFITTHRGQSLPATVIDALPTRSGSTRNQTYFPLLPQSLTDFDALAVLDSTAYNRGGPSLDH